MVRSRKDSMELCSYLAKVFEDRIAISVKKGYKDYYYLTGYFDDYSISFEIDRNCGYLIMYSSCDNSFMDELIPSISLFMDGKKPIAKYDYKSDGICVTTIEWCREIDNRIRMLKDSESSLYEISNVRTFVETTEEREKRLGFTELSPIFFPKGNLDDISSFSKMVDKYSEQDAYMALNSLSSVYFQLQVGKRSDLSFEKCNLALSIILNKISTFLDKEFNDPIEAFYSDEYYFWEKRWKYYFDYSTKCDYMEAKLKGEDTSCFYPECGKILKFERRGMKI